MATAKLVPPGNSTLGTSIGCRMWQHCGLSTCGLWDGKMDSSRRRAGASMLQLGANPNVVDVVCKFDVFKFE